MSADNARYSLGFLTAQYLMGIRGNRLHLPESTNAALQSERHLEGLRSQERPTRATWLARGLQPIAAALDERRWDAG